MEKPFEVQSFEVTEQTHVRDVLVVKPCQSNIKCPIFSSLMVPVHCLHQDTSKRTVNFIALYIESSLAFHLNTIVVLRPKGSLALPFF